MARRKQEVQLQQELETQEEWEEMLSKEGLTVIDIYQEWAGPCSAMVSNLRRVKNELGDDLLKFAIAKADSIDALEKYRGRCEPCFMYVASGMLVSIVRGASCPLILRTITEQLAQEHKVLDGNAERKEIRDPVLAEMDSADRSDEDEEDEKDEDEDNLRQLRYKGEIINFDDNLLEVSQSERKKEVTVAIIKPDAVQAGKTPEIMEQMQAAGIEILANEERQLTEEEAREFYSHLQDEEFYEDLIKFMTSGPCHVLVLTKGTTGENVIEEWRHLIGPTSVEEAKENAPESLRAKFGSEKFMNALHGSDSPDRASRELAFFFPNFNVPSIPGTVKLQRTLALIRPDAFKNSKDEILEKIRESGFSVALQKVVQLSKEQAEEFYKEHHGQEYFDELTTRMSSGPLLALGLAREDAVGAWRTMLGPTDVSQAKEEAPESLRAQFSVEETKINQLHGSDSEETAQKELDFFFPMQQTVAVIKPDAYGTKDEIIDKIHEAGFRIAARKETQLTKDIAEQLYADQKGKDHYDDLVEHMISGTTYFMVLSREDAVEGWRSLLGPTDPEKAKAEAPDTIRALYGTDIKQNAVHGSSDPEKAKQSIQAIFGDLEFNSDGTVKVEKLQQAAEQEQEQSQQSTEQGQQDETQQQQQESQPAQEELQEEKSSEDKKAIDEVDGEADNRDIFPEPVEEQTTEGEPKPEGETTGGAEGTEEPTEQEQQPEQQAESTEQQAESTEQQQESSEQQQTGEQQPESTEQQPDSAEQLQESTEQQQESTEQQQTSEQQPDTEQQSTEQQPAEQQQPDAAEQQQPDATEHQPDTEQQSTEQQSAEQQQPDAAEQQQPDAAEQQQPDAAEQQQPDAAEQQQPDAAEQQATTEQQATVDSAQASEPQQTAQEGHREKPAELEQAHIEQKTEERESGGDKAPSPTQGEDQSTTEPPTTEPESTEPQSSEPEPQSTDTDPQSTETEPQGTEPQSTEPEPQSTEPELQSTETEPQSTEPQSTETEPQSTEPAETGETQGETTPEQAEKTEEQKKEGETP